MRIEHSIEIAAPRARVWALTMDLERWPEITPTITHLERLDDAPLAVGSRVRIKQPGQGARIWTVTALDPQERFEWSARLMGTTMTATHQLSEAPGGTTNRLVIDIEGHLSALVGRLLRRPILGALRLENAGFKAAAERTDDAS
jgi:uncharacterized membrane protein